MNPEGQTHSLPGAKPDEAVGARIARFIGLGASLIARNLACVSCMKVMPLSLRTLGFGAITGAEMLDIL